MFESVLENLEISLGDDHEHDYSHRDVDGRSWVVHSEHLELVLSKRFLLRPGERLLQVRTV
jgi:hypothetical protein